MCIVNVGEPGCDVINFEINVIVLIKSFFYMNKKSRQKLKYLGNEKNFSSFLNGFQLPKIVSDMGVGL